MQIQRSTDPGPSRGGPDFPVASPALLREWVEAISVPRHFHYESNANRATALWLLERLREWGYDVSFHGENRNVLATPPGLTGAATMLGAHYDSVPGCAGADDNASAVAALLAAAQACAGVPGIAFIAFNREEDGLLGSTEFVRETLPGLPWSVGTAHILEMVGYASHKPGSQRQPDGLPVALPNRGDFLGLLANGHSSAALANAMACARGAVPELPVIGLEAPVGLDQLLPVLRRSDHVPFWDRGIPAVMWTDTAEFRNPHYHEESDIPPTLDYTFLASVSRLAAAVLRSAR